VFGNLWSKTSASAPQSLPLLLFAITAIIPNSTSVARPSMLIRSISRAKLSGGGVGSFSPSSEVREAGQRAMQTHRGDPILLGICKEEGLASASSTSHGPSSNSLPVLRSQARGRKSFPPIHCRGTLTFHIFPEEHLLLIAEFEKVSSSLL
jgi:hypothetical protein